VIVLSTCNDSVVAGFLDSIGAKIRREGSIFLPSSMLLSLSSYAEKQPVSKVVVGLGKAVLVPTGRMADVVD
jgi:hypothetical protein